MNRSPSALSWWQALAVAAVFVVAYGLDFGQGFISDDFAHILHGRLDEPGALGRIFGTSLGFYRPFVSLSFGIDHGLFGLNPLGYGLTNLALALACGALTGVLARELRVPGRLPLIAAAVWLFNFHGIGMSILWLSGRTSLLLTMFGVLAAIACLRGRTLASTGTERRRRAPPGTRHARRVTQDLADAPIRVAVPGPSRRFAQRRSGWSVVGFRESDSHGGPMAITGTHMLLYSSEPEALRATLRDVFGWPHVDAGEGWLIFALPPAEMGVHPAEGPTWESGVRHQITLMCDDVHATARELRAKGIDVKGDPKDEGWGISVMLGLPGGASMMLYEPRHLVAAKMGTGA